MEPIAVVTYISLLFSTASIAFAWGVMVGSLIRNRREFEAWLAERGWKVKR